MSSPHHFSSKFVNLVEKTDGQRVASSQTPQSAWSMEWKVKQKRLGPCHVMSSCRKKQKQQQVLSPINQSTNRSTNQPTHQSITHFTNQSSNRPNTQSINQTINHSTNHIPPTNQSIDQSNSTSVNQSPTSFRRRSPKPGKRVLPPDSTTWPNSVRRMSMSVRMMPFRRQSCTPMHSDPICSGWNRHSGARYRSGPTFARIILTLLFILFYCFRHSNRRASYSASTYSVVCYVYHTSITQDFFFFHKGRPTTAYMICQAIQ